MDIKQLLSLLLFFSLWMSLLQAQNGYYVTAEGQRVEKVKLRNQGQLINAKECLQILSEYDNLTLLPQQLQEYGFNLAQVYHSKMIIIEEEPTQVFLRLLVDGKMRLYSHSSRWGKRFFVEDKEGGLIEIEEFDLSDDSYNFQQALRSLCRDCVEAVDVVDQVKFNQASLTRFVEKYNICDERPLPKIRVGVLAGVNLSTLTASHSMEVQVAQEAVFPYQANPMFGAFVDLPLPARNLSLHLEAYYTSGNYWFEKITENYDTDVVVNLTSLSLPVLVRYTLPKKTIRPFFDVGVSLSRYLKNENGIQQTALQNGDTLSTYIINEEPIFDNTQISAVFGGGVILELPKVNLFAQARFHNYSIWVPTKMRLYRRELVLVGGIMF